MKTKAIVLITMLLSTIVTILNAQSFYDNSVFYSIENVKKGKKYPEKYKLYLDKRGFQPYLTKKSLFTKKDVTDKGDDFLIYEENDAIYLKYKEGKTYKKEMFFSLKEGDTTDIYTEAVMPLMVMFYGERAVFEGIEKVKIYDKIHDVYKFNLFFKDLFAMTVYLKKDDLVPVKYEMVFRNKITKEIKDNVVVQLEKVSGTGYNGDADITFLGKLEGTEAVAIAQ